MVYVSWTVDPFKDNTSTIYCNVLFSFFRQEITKERLIFVYFSFFLVLRILCIFLIITVRRIYFILPLHCSELACIKSRISRFTLEFTQWNLWVTGQFGVKSFPKTISHFVMSLLCISRYFSWSCFHKHTLLMEMHMVNPTWEENVINCNCWKLTSSRGTTPLINPSFFNPPEWFAIYIILQISFYTSIFRAIFCTFKIMLDYSYISLVINYY